MAPSNPDLSGIGPFRRAGAVPLAALLLCLPASASAQFPLDADTPISLDAASSDYDRRRDIVVFEGLTITQAGMRIDADHARASRLEFDDARWEFSGNVRLTLDDAVLQADEAQLLFQRHRLVHAAAQGGPARFEDRGSITGQHIEGSAHELEYDLENGVIRLERQAWLSVSDGANEFTGASLVYRLAEERVIAEGDEERIHITITPRGGQLPELPEVPGTDGDGDR